MLTPDIFTVSMRHSGEFESRVVLACQQAGASIAAGALENGVNANLVIAGSWNGEVAWSGRIGRGWSSFFAVMNSSGPSWPDARNRGVR